ncbi:MAG: FAD-dependent oxidoreductase [Pseudomonadota bacterium]
MTGSLAGVLGTAGSTLRFTDGVLRPIFLLFIRLWLARIFIAHAYESSIEGPIFGLSWLSFFELVASTLLILGFFTRLAALPIAYFSFFVYFVAGGITGHVLCTLLALSLFVYGAGPLSVDGLLGEGSRHSALPFSHLPQRVIALVQPITIPILQLVIRVWMGLLFLLTGEAILNSPSERWLDLSGVVSGTALGAYDVSEFATVLLFVAGIFLILGLLARFVAMGLAIATFAIMAGDQAQQQHFLWALVLLQISISGAGRFSIDAVMDGWLRDRVPEYTGALAFDLATVPRVAIVGAGFGGLAAAKALSRSPVRVTVIDRHNYHLFQPLLYQVATAGLAPSDIAAPIRSALREQANAEVFLGDVTDVDAEASQLVLVGQRISYDYLIVASGARHAYFGNDGWEQFAPGLKRIDDATAVRRRILLSFERAEAAVDEAERSRNLTFVVVGGGPTGVELAGSIAELAKQGMRDDFSHIEPAAARVILIQAGGRILPTFPPSLSANAQRSLEKIGVEVRLGCRVTRIDHGGCTIADEHLPAGVVLWAAGVRASSAAQWLDAEADRAGRVKVQPDLSVPGHPNVFVVGDTAAMVGSDGNPVPGLAPAAKQSGVYAARVIDARVRGGRMPNPFRYRHMGSLATIGRDAAVADFGRFRIAGRPAWWLWGAVHILFLLGTRNRFAVMLSWIWAYFSYRSASRLITGDHEVDMLEHNS